MRGALLLRLSRGRRQKKDPKRYKSRNPAKGLENLLYICPECGAYDSFVTEKDMVRCASCGHSFRYNAYGMLEETRFETVYEFSQWQCGQTEADVDANVAYTAPHAVLNRLEDHCEIPVTEGTMTMDRDRLVCGEMEIPMQAITDLAMHGQRALVFTANKQYYELLPSEGSNVFKFFRYYTVYKKNKINRQLTENVR